MKIGKLIKEFIRYLFVGGTAFIVDFTLLYIFKTYLFYNLEVTGVYISTALGFIGGLIYNYVLSLLYVFESAKENNKGKDIRSFIIFTIIGVVGLILTELGMFVGVELFAINYLIVKIFVAGVVLIWNYGIRKILIFK
ncbi:MAG: polysaccharide synthesis protein GtrA [Clostridiaceae bacterium]|jgi:putative flippase GtrA|nr:polysaccharide synthesis protein GtrA [Clostridiaceae bacterium]